jgi:predicted nucleic acid-binding protein
MRVIDTSAWIEWLNDGPVADHVSAELPPREGCIVPTIVLLELAKWLARELPEEEGNNALAYVSKCEVVPLDADMALLAAELCRTARLATADAIIYATARHFNVDLLTCDHHFKDLQDVIYLPKRAT